MADRFPFRRTRDIATAALLTLAVAGWSAHAGLTATAPGALAPPAPPVTGYEAQDHFPGAQQLYAEEPDTPPAPQPGTTGTIALPDIPVPTSTIDASVRPAQPFALRGTALDQVRALACLTAAIYYEAANEPDDGQAAVAQVVLNRVRHPAFPATVCGVVYQGSERAGCQFSFACDGAVARIPARVAWERARRVAARALAGAVFAPVGLATHYHTYAVRPSWQKTLVMTGVFGAHFFHRWQGWWGTSAAFSQRYWGGEPVPGPHPRADSAPMIAALPVPAPEVRAAAPAATPTATIVAAHRDSGTPLAAYADADSQILDKWKDSGKPLR